MIVGLGYQTATVVSHDWGGALAWSFATVHPSMVEQLVVMNAPHPGRRYRFPRLCACLSRCVSSWVLVLLM